MPTHTLAYRPQPVAAACPSHSLVGMPRSADVLSGALESLLQRYRESVVAVGRRHGLSDQLLDEAMQELRIRLWRAFPGSDQLAAVSAGYVYRAAVTAALMVLRRRRAKRESGVEVTQRFEESTPTREPGPAETLDESELAERVARAIDELPSARQAVVRLHLRGYHREEIAELLGWSEAKTRNLLYRGLDDLRALLAGRGIGPGAAV